MQDKKQEKGKKVKGNLFDARILKRLFGFAQPYIRYFYLTILLILVVGALSAVKPYLIKLTVDDYIMAADAQGLNNMFILLIAISLILGVLQFVQAYLSGWLGQNIVKDIRVKLYRHLLGQRLRFYDKNPIGTLITRNVSDIETLSDVFTNGLAAIAGDLLQLIFIFAVMLYTDWKLTLVTLSMFPLLFVSTYIFKEKIKASFNEVRTAVSNLNAFVQEHVTGMNIVQIFNSEARELKKFQNINREHRRAQIKTVLYYSVYFPVAEVIGASGTGLLVWYGGRGVLNEEVSLGDLISFLLYISMFFRPIRMIADRFNTLQLGIVSAERVLALLDSQEQIPDNGTIRPDNLRGEVQFDKVSFSYEGKESPNLVLKNISFKVNPGETVAIVGATGAGKSSIVSLLTKYYEINSGTISVDGIPLDDYDIGALRSKIGVVLQDVFLFSGTIRDNITLGNPEIGNAAVEEAARLIGATPFIEKMPGGFDYDVMERGGTLSTGQRQLISFIRALVYNPQVIILDEATSSVDSETEALIQQAIEKMMKGRTAIIIAHRLATIKKADRIIVLEKGEIMEEGTHESLLQKGGYYAKLHQMQFKELG